jgi:glycosidase/MoaA/NifB/PqqE/SkfB family radical SAM enzyme
MVVESIYHSDSSGLSWAARLALSLPNPQPRTVELFGEPRDWLTPSPLHQLDDRWSIALELPCGVYAYKFRVDGNWLIDPDNARTRSRGGNQNSVLCLGGSPEPLLFAPAAPWTFEDVDGATVITAALRRGAGDRLRVLWSECDSHLDHSTEMLCVLEEDEHKLYRARLPLSASRSRICFELEDGRRVAAEDGEWFQLARSASADPLPAWWSSSCIYTIFVDRYRPEVDRPDWEVGARRDEPAGGHLEGIRRSLGELSDLGINVIYLTPIHVAAHCHRYDLIDPLRVDPALGGEAAFRRLIDDAHARGIRVLLDFSFAHVGRGFVPYEDVLEHGKQSCYAGWFQWTTQEPGSLKYYGRRKDAPLLDLDHPDVRDLVMQVADMWARMGIDGLRLDAAAEVPPALAREIRSRLTSIRKDALVLGEVVPEHAWRWRAERSVDAATDFGFHTAATEFIAKRTIDAAEACRWMVGTEVARGGPECASVRFLSTHDHCRFATYARLHGDPARGALGLLALLTSPGVPALLYGEEIGLAADLVELLPEAVWEDRAPMPWQASLRDLHLRGLVRRLLAARSTSPALLRGSRTFQLAEGPLMVYRRAAEGEVIDIAINASDTAIEFDMEDDQLDLIEPMASVGEVRVAGQSVTLGANGGLVARRAMSSRARAALRQGYTANLLARDDAFAAGSAEVRSRPTRIDLTVTERCNMQCRHCLNNSPEKTRDRSAREMTRAVLDRLLDSFAYADYFGFVHGGESLASPLFFDVLAAIREAVGRRSYGVHLLTNGLLLTADQTQKFIRSGGTSLSVSLDGATASTNDAVRGGFDKVVAHIGDAVRVRRQMSSDLRIGLSCVVMGRNLNELAAFVELAARLGVDWVKFEELVVTGSYHEPPLAHLDAVGEAMTRGKALGLVMVDHTCPPAVWRCRLEQDQVAAEFLAADEFANRSTIHPCRAPWDHACIDPNGDVHCADFFAPVVGNVMQQTLAEIWKEQAAQGERLRSKARRVCPAGKATC